MKSTREGAARKKGNVMNLRGAPTKQRTKRYLHYANGLSSSVEVAAADVYCKNML